MGIVYVLLMCQLLSNKKNPAMTEIHVQAKRRSSSAWLWILISIIILGTIAFILLWNNNAEVRDKVSKPSQTSMIYPVTDGDTSV